ncbi:hypothetical protein F383_03864 [Gossypium arboreum]|uniref:Uncharacterized protein n=1 Tax=Gossypium arboreum TaxID=29729 RepID=A0A0B0PD24_GOSAR|nr:hypothetical protein F383_03864 [Gossypium arboreum]
MFQNLQEKHILIIGIWILDLITLVAIRVTNKLVFGVLNNSRIISKDWYR